MKFSFWLTDYVCSFFLSKEKEKFLNIKKYIRYCYLYEIMSIVLVNVFQEHETKSQLFFVQSYSQKHMFVM